MFFTQEDFKKIKDYLNKTGLKDSDFPISDNLTGNELITMVQDGNNVKMTLRKFLESFRTSNFINVSEIGKSTNKYSLEEAIREVPKPARTAGCLITYLDKDTLDWKVYQFLGTDVDLWYDLEYWRNILEKTESKFRGYFITEDNLYNTLKNPEIGDYAFVGNTLGDALVYTCNTRFVWTKTNQKATDFLTIILQGNITIGSNGNWFENGIDTGIKAQGPAGKDAVIDNSFSNTSENGVQNKLITERFNELEKIVFPFEINFTVTPTLLEYTGNEQSVNISYQIIKRDNLINANLVNITKDNTAIYTKMNISTDGISSTVNKRGTTNFNIVATYNEESKSKTIGVNMVLPIYFGFNSNNDINNIDITSLNKQSIKTSPNGTYTLNNPTTGNYLWLCVPDNMNINKVTSSGFDFPIEASVTKTTSLGNYKCYRSSSQINQGNVTILIS